MFALYYGQCAATRAVERWELHRTFWQRHEFVTGASAA